MLKPIEKVALVGGTHGNEVTGIALLQHLNSGGAEELKKRPFQIDTYIANQAAYEQNRRYLDNDLNRCFRKDMLADDSLKSHEDRLAKELNQLIGPKGDAKSDFVIDLHTTTANMQVSILLTNYDRFHRQLAAYLKQVLPHQVYVHCVDEVEGDHPYLCSICDKGFIIEVGPTPQGLLRNDVYIMMRDALLASFDFIEHYNAGTLPPLPDSIDAFRFLHTVTLPVGEDGRINGMVHSSLQDRDYQPLAPGEPLFQLFDGTDIPYQGEEVVYPVFVNEAAYYDQNLAVSLQERFELSGINSDVG